MNDGVRIHRSGFFRFLFHVCTKLEHTFPKPQQKVYFLIASPSQRCIFLIGFFDFFDFFLRCLLLCVPRGVACQLSVYFQFCFQVSIFPSTLSGFVGRLASGGRGFRQTPRTKHEIGILGSIVGSKGRIVGSVSHQYTHRHCIIIIASTRTSSSSPSSSSLITVLASPFWLFTLFSLDWFRKTQKRLR